MMDDLNPEPHEFSLPDEAFEGAVVNDPTVHRRATNAYPSSAWVQGPGAVALLVEAARDLLAVSALRGQVVNEVEFVRLLALPAAKTLLIWPTDEKDLQKKKVTWIRGVAKLNASTVLRGAKMPVGTRKRNRYTVHVLKESKVGPALAIDMRYELETRLLKKRGKGKGHPPKGV